VELTAAVLPTSLFTFTWITLDHISSHTRTLLKEQGVLYSRQTAIIPS